MRIVIIGGGPAGYTAAFESARLGYETTLIENREIGGTCLNRGCIPTKTLRASADVLQFARQMANFGLSGCQNPMVDLPALRARKEKITSVLREGLVKSCAALKVRLLHGSASLAASHKIEAQTENGRETLEYDKLLIATGSNPLRIPGFAFDGKHICDSDDALKLAEIPKSVIIVGGGVIGCEMACVYRDFGSEVTVVEGLDRLLPLPSVDKDVSALMQREFRKRKISTAVGKTLKNAVVEDGLAKAILAPSPFLGREPEDKSEKPIQAEMILITVGRAPNIASLGLDAAGVAVDKRGWIIVDEYLQTNIPDIYAAGDALGPAHVMLAHVASFEGMLFADNLAGDKKAMNYDVVPSAIFTSPEAAMAGLTEEQAREKGLDPVCGTVQMRELGKAQAMGELAGFFKVVAAGANGKLLGTHIVGAHASDLIAEATLAMNNGLTLDQIANTIHAHPTLAEGFYEAALAARRNLKR